MKKAILGVLILLFTFSVQSCGGGDNDGTDLSELLPPSQGGIPGGTTGATINDIALTLGQETVVADGSTQVLVRAAVLNVQGDPMTGTPVNFTTTAGTLSADSAVTDSDGRAVVFLTAPTKPAVADIFAEVSGLSKKGQVFFVPGPPDTETSLISVLPKNLPADGVSEATVTVSLYDQYDNPVANGTKVTLLSNGGGTIFTDAPGTNPRTSNSSKETSGGSATFYYAAPNHAGTVTLSLAEYADLTQTVNVGALSSGEPANIRISVSNPQIAVNGVGQIEQTTFKIEVLDDAGNFIDEGSYQNELLNNLRVSFATRPRGGEYVTGPRAEQDADGNIFKEFVDTRETGFIEIRTEGGSVNLSLKSGILPGAVELRIEVLYDSKGELLSSEDRVVAALPLAVIASGPPHTIVLTSPITNSVENLGGGVYRRIGTAIVTDRYGNTVPDGTAIHLGLIDSVIAAGSATINGTTVTADEGGIFNAEIIRNDYIRGIQANDRVLLMDIIPPQDKSRHVSSKTDGTTLEVQTPYSIEDSEKNFIVGASLLGGHIAGTLERGNIATLTPGTTMTQDGLANIFVTYPANSNTIGIGCGWVPQLDTRHLPVNSARVFVVVESSADPGPLDLDPQNRSFDRTATIDEGRFCFSPIAGFGLEAIPTTLQLNNNSAGIITLILRDGGDEIRIPFWPISAFVEIIQTVEGSSFAVTASGCITDGMGICDSTVSVTGATLPGQNADGDRIPGIYIAEITYRAGDGMAKSTVKVVVP
jgi:hypothetical protein